MGKPFVQYRMLHVKCKHFAARSSVLEAQGFIISFVLNVL